MGKVLPFKLPRVPIKVPPTKPINDDEARVNQKVQTRKELEEETRDE